MGEALAIKMQFDEQGIGDYPYLDHESVSQYPQPVATHRQIQAEVRIRQAFAPEIEHLKVLWQVNPNLRDEEIQLLALKSSNLRLDVVRVIVVT